MNLSDREFPFGKYKGYHLWEIADDEPSYFEWWIKNVDNDFTEYVKEYYKQKFPHGY